MIPMNDRGRQPKVSILITAYNAERYIHASVSAALAQRYPNFEVVVVNDGSSDKTGEICAAIRDSRLRYLSRGRLGRARALNEGIAAAAGDYIAINDADDLSLPGRLAYSMEVACAHPDLAYLGTWYIRTAHFRDQTPSTESSALKEGASDRIVWPAPAMVYLRNMFVNSTLLYPKSTWERIGGYDERLPLSEDYDFQLRALQCGRAAWLPRRTVVWYENPESFFKKKSKREQWESLGLIRRRARRLLRLPLLLGLYHPVWVMMSECTAAVPVLRTVMSGVRDVIGRMAVD